jgi:hypothetical protein
VSVTTATVLVCSKCGVVSHLDGGTQTIYNFCPIDSNRHTLKPVLVVVPYA